MKKLLAVLGLVVLVPGLALAQVNYFVDYFANNPAATTPTPSIATSAPDQIVRVINTGLSGSPINLPTGDICASFYVHNADQEMVACCASNLTPNELSSAYVGKQLTSNSLNSGAIPASGVVKILLTPNPTGATCDPTNLPIVSPGIVSADPPALGQVFATHLQVTNGKTYVTETEKLQSPLNGAEAGYLVETCFFVQLIGSGTGVCSISTSTGQN